MPVQAAVRNAAALGKPLLRAAPAAGSVYSCYFCISAVAQPEFPSTGGAPLRAVLHQLLLKGEQESFLVSINPATPCHESISIQVQGKRAESRNVLLTACRDITGIPPGSP